MDSPLEYTNSGRSVNSACQGCPHARPVRALQVVKAARAGYPCLNAQFLGPFSTIAYLGAAHHHLQVPPQVALQRLPSSYVYVP